MFGDAIFQDGYGDGSNDWWRGEDEYCSYRASDTVVRDPLYYHSWFKFKEIREETEKAYLIKVKGYNPFWVAKSLIKRKNDSKILVHTQIFTKCLNEHKKVKKLKIVNRPFLQ